MKLLEIIMVILLGAFVFFSVIDAVSEALLVVIVLLILTVVNDPDPFGLSEK